jgi:hypothetical protein
MPLKKKQMSNVFVTKTENMKERERTEGEGKLIKLRFKKNHHVGSWF